MYIVWLILAHIIIGGLTLGLLYVLYDWVRGVPMVSLKHAFFIVIATLVALGFCVLFSQALIAVVEFWLK